MGDESETRSGGGVANTISWVLKAAVRLVVLIVLVLAIVLGVQYMIQQLERRFDSVDDRVGQLQDDMDRLLEVEDGRQERLGEVESELTGQGDRLAALSETVEDDLSRQLSDLLSETTGFVSSSETVSESIVSLKDRVTIAEEELDQANEQNEALVEDLEAMQSELTSLETQLGDVEELLTQPDPENVQFRYLLALFHSWELISRARVRLAENNPGLAAADVERVQQVITLLVDQGSEDQLESLEVVQGRLELAQNALPEGSIAAARDLEVAWETLDQLIVRLLLPEDLLPEVEEAGPEPTATPTS